MANHQRKTRVPGEKGRVAANYTLGGGGFSRQGTNTSIALCKEGVTPRLPTETLNPTAVTFKVKTPPLPKPYLRARPFMRDTPRMRAADRLAPPSAPPPSLELPSSSPSSFLGVFKVAAAAAAAAPPPCLPAAVLVSAAGPPPPPADDLPFSALGAAAAASVRFRRGDTASARFLVPIEPFPTAEPGARCFSGAAAETSLWPDPPGVSAVGAEVSLPSAAAAAAASAAGSLDAEGGFEIEPAATCLLVFFGDGEDTNGSEGEEVEEEKSPLGPLARSSAVFPSCIGCCRSTGVEAVCVPQRWNTGKKRGTEENRGCLGGVLNSFENPRQ